MAPVPWVTRREGEHVKGQMEWTMGIAANPITGEPRYYLENKQAYRDEDGWLWIPSVTAMDSKPEWTQVHPERQRRCMDEIRCQVCGELTDDPFWVGRPDQLVKTVAGLTMITYTPPVCPRCMPVAAVYCPWLRRHPWSAYRARRVLRWGVLGDVYAVGESGAIEREDVLQKFDPDAGRMLARQRVLRVVGLTEIDERELKTRTQR